MKTLTTTFSMIAISLLHLSCGNTSTEKPKEQIETVLDEEHQHEGEMQTIELNHGEKWKVDAHMLVHIRNMESDINSLGKYEQKDYILLAENLQSNIDLFTSNCTMKGKAHDELHKWLLPFIDFSNVFFRSKTEQEFALNFQKIKTSFATFNTYFE